MDSSLDNFKGEFIEEAISLLNQLEKDLLELEKNPQDKGLIESAFRVMHSIKGASGMFGFVIIENFAHRVENLYQMIRDGVMTFNRDVSEITFQSVDHIRHLLGDEDMSSEDNKNIHNQILNNLAKYIGKTDQVLPAEKIHGVQKPDTGTSLNTTWHILVQTSESIANRGIKVLNIFRDLSKLGEYEITKIHNLGNETTEFWSIILHTSASEEEIQDAFLFILDDCAFVNIGQNYVNETNRSKIPPEESFSSLSIIDYIENHDKSSQQVQNNLKASTPTTTNTTQTISKKRISVDASKLDQLMFLVSELITINSQLNLTTNDRQYNQIKPYIEKLDALSKNFRNNVFEIRLVPLSDTIIRFQRLIRDLSKQLNKKINFITQGANTELDKNTIEQLTDPLMHIIRNCIDHGIELPLIRKQNGKSETGTITLNAFNSGNHVFISISDDGCGIDHEKIKQKAIDMGLLKSTDNPNIKDLYDFIFAPGFSTAQNLTELSGRGVGMDVVKKKITNLRGEVFVNSEKGKGTSFTLKIPQSISIVDSLLFVVDQNYFTVPISDIAVCTQTDCSTIDDQRHTGTLPFNNHLIPFVDLRKLFHLEGTYSENMKTIIIRNQQKEMALLCDKIIGGHQAVLKPLGKALRKQEYITAASQMGDGKMAFMIDTTILFKETA